TAVRDTSPVTRHRRTPTARLAPAIRVLQPRMRSWTATRRSAPGTPIASPGSDTPRAGDNSTDTTPTGRTPPGEVAHLVDQGAHALAPSKLGSAAIEMQGSEGWSC